MSAVLDSDLFEDWMSERVSHIEQVLDSVLPAANVVPHSLHDAMRYSVLGGGKRVRACLVYCSGETINGKSSSDVARLTALDYAAAAVELIHAYSLVHDDLPCMDDDDLRRGKPSVHVQYNEATAMLTGDALQPLAFELLAQMPVAPALVVQSIQILSRAIGSMGMVGGQAIDCDNTGQEMQLTNLQQMHRMKTGALLEASVLLGGIVSGAGSRERQALEAYAKAIGLAFQVMDDILDVTADTATLGKTAGKDAAAGKPTYVSVLGLNESRQFLQTLQQQANDAILPLGQSAFPLAGMVNFIVSRIN